MLNQNEERLQKALARAGIASRRACEELIVAGRVKVNGRTVTELGTKIDAARDKVTVDEAPVNVRPSGGPQKVYLMLNKPTGYLSTVSDPQGRPTIMDLLQIEGNARLYPVGRLDADSAGLLLITNDGAFANALSHPRFGVEKEYVALLDGIVALKDIEQLRAGVPIRVEDPETGEHSMQKTRPAKVDLIRHEGSNTLVRFILKEGKKRQIRLMAEVVEHPVLELKRVRYGLLRLADLPSGKYRALSKAEVHSLVESARHRAENSAEPVAPKSRSDNRSLPGRAPAAPGGRSRAFPPRPAEEGAAPARGRRPTRPGGPATGPREDGPGGGRPARPGKFGNERSGGGSRPSGPGNERSSDSSRSGRTGGERSSGGGRPGGPGRRSPGRG